MMNWRLHPVSFAALPGWADDSQEAAVEPLRRSAGYLAGGGTYRTGGLGIQAEDYSAAFAALRTVDAADRLTCRDFFEKYFVAARLQPLDGGGFVTGFYEPDLAVSRRRCEIYRYPIYGRPDDLLKPTETEAPEAVAAGVTFGRRTFDGAFVPFFDRAAIEGGALEGRGLEIAWARDRVDLFFVHIQGAARLRFSDGSSGRITYAGKSGHPFTAIGRVLIELGEIDPAAVTMGSLRRWLARNPERHEEILHRNRSFIFFRETLDGARLDGPVAAAKVPLTAGRSLAVDRLIHGFGTPIFVTVPMLKDFSDDRHNDAGFARLMVAQDTGSAIIGPARGDIFTGCGDKAGTMAGRIKHHATFHVLLPHPAAERLL